MTRTDNVSSKKRLLTQKELDELLANTGISTTPPGSYAPTGRMLIAAHVCLLLVVYDLLSRIH